MVDSEFGLSKEYLVSTLSLVKVQFKESLKGLIKIIFIDTFKTNANALKTQQKNNKKKTIVYFHCFCPEKKVSLYFDCPF